MFKKMNMTSIAEIVIAFIIATLILDAIGIAISKYKEKKGESYDRDFYDKDFYDDDFEYYDEPYMYRA